jgi:hypothetical protein
MACQCLLYLRLLSSCLMSISLIILGTCFLLNRLLPARQEASIIHYSLQNIHRLAKLLNTSNEDEPDISMLFQLIQAIQRAKEGEPQETQYHIDDLIDWFLYRSIQVRLSCLVIARIAHTLGIFSSVFKHRANSFWRKFW